LSSCAASPAAAVVVVIVAVLAADDNSRFHQDVAASPSVFKLMAAIRDWRRRAAAALAGYAFLMLSLYCIARRTSKTQPATIVAVPDAKRIWLYGNGTGNPVRTTGIPRPIGNEAAIRSVSRSLAAARISDVTMPSPGPLDAFKLWRHCFKAHIHRPKADRNQITHRNIRR
jgi:hypothetical protein